MAITQRTPDGGLIVLTAQGWRLATPEEEAAQGVSRLEAFSMQLLAQPSRYGRFIESAAALPYALAGQPLPAPGPESFTARNERIEKALAPVAAAHPGASASGAFWTDPLNVTGAVALSGALKRRVVRRISQSAAVRQAAVPPSAVQGASQAEQVPGFSSVGAAATREGLIKRHIRGPQAFFRDLREGVDEFLSPEKLTPDQRAMLPVGERLGFKFLPGQKSGSQGLRRLATSDPLVEAAFAPELRANEQGLRAAVARAIGSGSDDFGRNLLGDTASRVDDGMREIASAVGELQLGDDLVQRIELVRKTEPFITFAPGGQVSGEQALQLKSSMEAVARNAWAAPGQAAKAEFAESVADDLVELIGSRLSPQQQVQWRQLRQWWKNLKVVEAPHVVNASGQINAASLDARLLKFYKGAYLRTLTGEEGRRAGLSQATLDLMDWTRLSRQFADNFPNSGTAMRNRLVQVMTQPRELAKSLMLRAAIESQTP